MSLYLLTYWMYACSSIEEQLASVHSPRRRATMQVIDM